MLKQPESEEDINKLIYYSRRKIDGGHVVAWVYRQKCASCGKSLMGKPRDKKTGKVKIRAKEYVCPECENSTPKKEYEESLKANAIYTCPHCSKKGESTIPYKRKKVKGVDTLRFKCEHCGDNIDLAKKMKGET